MKMAIKTRKPEDKLQQTQDSILKTKTIKCRKLENKTPPGNKGRHCETQHKRTIWFGQELENWSATDDRQRVRE